MKQTFLILLVFGFLTLKAQSTAVLPSSSVIAVDKKGEALRNYYLSLDVENLWLAGSHVKWQTGEADMPDATSGIKTHCSAFVAAACKGLNIYILRPPEHKQILLANAQYEWLSTQAAIDAGWKPVEYKRSVYDAAQTLANRGYVVVAVFKNAEDKKPGHIALIMPEEITFDKIEKSGPTMIQAGQKNYNKVSLKTGFKYHLEGAWPENVVAFYYNINSN